MERPGIARQVLLDAEDVRAAPWRPFGDRGAVEKVLWEDGHGSYAGLLRLDPGAGVVSHVHRYAVHHVWVADGTCGVGGRTLGSGSYWFIPAGCSHEISGVGASGCTLLYLYIRAELD